MGSISRQSESAGGGVGFGDLGAAQTKATLPTVVTMPSRPVTIVAKNERSIAASLRNDRLTRGWNAGLHNSCKETRASGRETRKANWRRSGRAPVSIFWNLAAT